MGFTDATEEQIVLYLHHRLMDLEEERETILAAGRRAVLLEGQIKRMRDLCDYLSPRPYPDVSTVHP